MEEPQSAWRINKNINIVDLFTMIALCLTAVLYLSRIEQRVAVVESHQAVQKERDERQDRALEASLMLVRESVNKLESKIDRLIDSKNGKS